MDSGPEVLRSTADLWRAIPSAIRSPCGTVERGSSVPWRALCCVRTSSWLDTTGLARPRRWVIRTEGVGGGGHCLAKQFACCQFAEAVRGHGTSPSA